VESNPFMFRLFWPVFACIPFDAHSAFPFSKDFSWDFIVADIWAVVLKHEFMSEWEMAEVSDSCSLRDHGIKDEIAQIIAEERRDACALPSPGSSPLLWNDQNVQKLWISRSQIADAFVTGTWHRMGGSWHTYDQWGSSISWREMFWHHIITQQITTIVNEMQYSLGQPFNSAIGGFLIHLRWYVMSEVDRWPSLLLRGWFWRKWTWCAFRWWKTSS
jgi:hypothetical protein